MRSETAAAFAAALVENAQTLPDQRHAVNDYFPIISRPILHEMFRRMLQRARHLLRLDNLLGVALILEPDVGPAS
jgi:hypothetical protein